MKVAAYTDALGKLCILIPAKNVYLKDGIFKTFRGAAPEGWQPATIEQIATHDAPAAFIITETYPQDRYFRSAWKIDGASVGVDMDKAREIHMGRIRESRDKELAKLDIEARRGNDNPVRAQYLRDLPQTFSLAEFATPEDLKAAWPADLPRP